MNDFYQNLIWSLPDIVYQIDAEGRFVYLNDSIQKIGYTPEELIGRHFGSIIAPRDQNTVNILAYLTNPQEPLGQTVMNFFNERRTGKRMTRRLQVLLKCKQESGATIVEFRDCEVYATGMYETRSRGGKFIGTVGIIRETSDYTLSEKTLERIERYYRLLVENSSELITITAHDGSILYVSKSSEKNLGFEPFDLIGDNIVDMIHRDDAYPLKRAFLEESDIGESIGNLELRILTREKRWKYFNTSVTPIREEGQKNVMCYVLHCTDITKRKEIEDALLKRERMYKLLLHTSPDAVALFDNEGDIIMINEKGASIMGTTQLDLIGTGYADLILEEETKMINGIIEVVINKGITTEFQFTLKRTDGNTLPVEAGISSIKNRKGEVEGYLTVFRDITKRTKAENERRRLEEELLSVIIGRLSDREIELLHIIHRGHRWPEQKREIGKIMDALPGTLDQFITRIKKKKGMNDIGKITRISAQHFKWDGENL